MYLEDKDNHKGLLIYWFTYLLILDRGKVREKERVRHMNIRETWMSCLSYMLQLGTEPPTQAHALTGNQTSDLSLCGTTPN